MVSFKYKPIKYNFSSRYGRKIEWIVIHDTANPRKGATAYNHYRYFGGGDRRSSAHYFVDSKEIIQIVGDSKAAWHCGDRRSRNSCTNFNSIGVEICINADGDYEKAVYYAIELVKNLMVKFKIPLERVCRHKDVTGKNCPGTFSEEDWKDFKKRLGEPMEILFDLDKDSEGVYLKKEDLTHKDKDDVKDKEDEKEEVAEEEKITTLIEHRKLNILKTKSTNIYQQFMKGDTLLKRGAYGINGTFFDTKHKITEGSIWGIAVNNGVPLGPNSDRVDYNKAIRKGTLYIDWHGNCGVKTVNNILELGKVKFAVSGVGLTPTYDPKAERTRSDILGFTWHTAIGYKGTDVYLITTRQKMSMVDFKKLIDEFLRLEGVVALDGGGSTEFYYKKRWQGSGRGLASAIGIREFD